MCYCLDLRSNSNLAKVLSHKIIAAIIAIIQLGVISGSTELISSIILPIESHHVVYNLGISAVNSLIAPPQTVRYQMDNSPSGAVAFAVIFILTGIGFSILLLLGILKSNRTFIQVYCVFIIVVIVLLLMSILVNIFTQPARFGLSGFLSSSLIILVDVLTYFIVRNHYLGLTSPVHDRNPNAMRV